MWDGQSVRKPLKWKLKKLLTVVYYLLISLVMIASLCLICLLEIYKLL